MSLTARLGITGIITIVALLVAVALVLSAMASGTPTELLAGPGGCCPTT
jgi:hypothetical protein